MKHGPLEEKDVHAFETQQKFEQWLRRNHAASEGIFLRIFKKDSGRKTVTYDQAVEEALCYGWIDGVRKRFDEDSSVQWFCPRRPRSVWSRINTERAERLIQEGRMKPSGLAQVEAAKADGRWARAYESFSKAEVPKDFLAALAKNKKAKAFFESLNRQNVFAIAFRLHNAKKPETRERRMKQFLEMMARGEKFHP